MTEKIIKCAKCQNNAEIDPRIRRSEYTATYPIRDKDGQIYCWDCYKNKSYCEGCQKSVANIKFPWSRQPEYPHCNGGYSVNCERISNEVKFICSKKCSENLSAQKYQSWKDKLSQGWTKCEECVELANWLKDIMKEHQAAKSWGEKHYSKIITLVHPSEGKLCKRCRHNEEVEKPHQAEIKAQAQKYWDALSYEIRLKEVIRSGSVGWGEKFKDLTAEQIAAQNEVPRGIVYEFELKDCHRGCQDCHLDKDFKNSSGNRIASLSCNGNEVEKLENELIEAKQQKKSTQEIERIKSELEKLNNQQKEETKPTKTNNDMLTWGIGIFFISALVLGIIILVSKNNKRKKNN